MQMFLKKLFWSSGFNRSSKQRVTDLTQARRPLRLEALEDRRMLSITLFVDDDATSASPDGLAWDTAYADLQSALDRAAELNADATAENDITQIWIAEGTYYPTAQLEPDDLRSATFSLVDGVSLYGGFAGTETTLDERILGPEHTTILSGDLNKNDEKDIAVEDLLDHPTRQDNAYSVLYGLNANALVVSCLTVVGGNANNDGWYQSRGGGFYVANSQATIEDSVFRENAASNGGGGVCGYTSKGCIHLCVNGSTFMHNYASSGSGINIYASESTDVTLTVADTVVKDNYATFKGGGISSIAHQTTIVNSRIIGNIAGMMGGGIYNGMVSGYGVGKLLVANSTIIGNAGGYQGGGGIYYSSSGSSSSPNIVKIINSNITGNSSYIGGGIYSSVSSSHLIATIVSSTIAGNIANIGGGLYNYSYSCDVKIKLYNSIFADNTALENAPQIYFPVYPGTELEHELCSYNSLVEDGPGIDGANGFTWAINQDSLIVDPQFKFSLPAYRVNAGDDNIWGTEDDRIGNYQLFSTSPAVDHGNDTYLSYLDENSFGVDLDNSGVVGDYSITHDLAGSDRKCGAASVDMGAYEYSGLQDPALDYGDFGNRLYVDGDSIGSNDGTSWENAFVRLNDALWFAFLVNQDGNPLNDIAEISIADGIYFPTKYMNRDDSFELVSHINLVGGYGGVSESNPNIRDITTYETILSGDLGINDGSELSGDELLIEEERKDNSHTVIRGYGVTDVCLDGLVITGGNAELGNAKHNFAMQSGGGVWLYQSDVTVINSLITRNSACDGGGIFCCSGMNATMLLIENSTIIENHADYGGGIYNSYPSGNATVIVVNSTIAKNSAWCAGGGVYNVADSDNSKIEIINSIIVENTAWEGGGIYSYAKNGGNPIIVVVNSTIAGNFASDNGGGLACYSNAITYLHNTIISGNSASNTGSQIYRSINRYVTNVLHGHNCLVEGGEGLDGANGFTWTTSENNIIDAPMFVDAENGDYRLMANSSAVNAGDNALAVDQEGQPLEVDLDGQTRIQGGAVDIGAYESSVGTWGNVWIKIRDRAGNEELEWMDEWTGCWVEVWGRGVAARGIGGFDVELGFVPDYFTPDMTKVVPGDAVDGEALTTTLDGVAGKLRMEGSTLTDDAGQDAYVMLAKVYFKPTPGESSLPRDTDGRYLTPVEDVGFQISESELIPHGASDHYATAMTYRMAVPLWPVMYDLDGNSTIDLMDVSQFVSVFQMTADENALPMAWASDFDRSGKVDLVDLSQMLARFHWQKGDGDSVSYPDEFPFATPGPPDYVLQADTTSSIWSIDDFDGEGVPDGTGVTILAGNWQYAVMPLSVSAEPAFASLCCNDAIFSNSLWDETDLAAVAKDLAIDAEEESFWLKDELFDLNLDLFDEY